MPVVILWTLVAVVGFVLTLATVYHVPRVLSHRRHDAALVRIAKLERELGIVYDPADDEPLILKIQRADAEHYKKLRQARIGMSSHERILGFCDLCERTVAINDGRCVAPRSPSVECAKVIYSRRLPG